MDGELVSEELMVIGIDETTIIFMYSLKGLVDHGIIELYEIRRHNSFVPTRHLCSSHKESLVCFTSTMRLVHGALMPGIVNFQHQSVASKDNSRKPMFWLFQ